LLRACAGWSRALYSLRIAAAKAPPDGHPVSLDIDGGSSEDGSERLTPLEPARLRGAPPYEKTTRQDGVARRVRSGGNTGVPLITSESVAARVPPPQDRGRWRKIATAVVGDLG
jgi:hypothetical protein